VKRPHTVIGDSLTAFGSGTLSMGLSTTGPMNTFEWYNYQQKVRYYAGVTRNYGFGYALGKSAMETGESLMGRNTVSIVGNIPPFNSKPFNGFEGSRNLFGGWEVSRNLPRNSFETIINNKKVTLTPETPLTWSEKDGKPSWQKAENGVQLLASGNDGNIYDLSSGGIVMITGKSLRDSLTRTDPDGVTREYINANGGKIPVNFYEGKVTGIEPGLTLVPRIDSVSEHRAAPGDLVAPGGVVAGTVLIEHTTDKK